MLGRHIQQINIATLVCIALTSAASAQGNWERGNIVGLRAGTCIREGPGLQYRAHTQVPENDWLVMVIDGPSIVGDRVWWDTSRRAAGDPSGGTGWVTQDQADTDCGTAGAPAPISPNPPAATSGNTPSLPEPEISDTTSTNLNFFEVLQTWWYQQPAMVKWAIAVIFLLLIPVLWRFIGGVIIEGIVAMFLALIIWIVLDLTRPFWQQLWLSLANPLFGSDIPDLALLLGVLPIVSWALMVLRRLILTRRYSH